MTRLMPVKRKTISDNPIIGFIGFGEVAYHLSKGLKEEGIRHILAYDKAATEPEYGLVIQHRARDAGVELAPTLHALVTGAEWVVSAVHGHVALEVARDAARFIGAGGLYADLNNTPPLAKKLAAGAINARGARFVDIGLFEPPAQVKHKALMYASGDGAAEFRDVMSRYGMDIHMVSGEAGKATTIKTLANIYIKGLQALCLELALCARKADVELDLLGPLVVRSVRTLPREKELAFWILRGGLHAARKMGELPGIVQAISEWGVKPTMIEATLERFKTIAQYELKEQLPPDLPVEDYQLVLEAIEARERESRQGRI